MAPEIRRRDDEAALLLALFRYGVIAPLAETAPENLPPGEVTKLVREIAGETHFLPGKGPLRVAERTVYAWLSAYRRAGIESLRPRVRADRGSSRFPEELFARAVELRREGEHRFTKTLLDILRLEAASGSSTALELPHRSTLDRHLARRSASRRQMRVLGEKRTIKMRVASFGDLWVGDYHHGPPVLTPDGKPTTAKLGAFLDHATRYPVADRYYLAEDLASLRDCLLRALLTWGRAVKVYVDRGAVYRSDMLRYSLATAGIHLVHSRPYYSQGRGVIERWWQVIDQFEQEVRLRDELLSIHELNLYWEAYRERRYVSEVHSELAQTPAEAIVDVTPKPLDPELLRELFLVRADRTVHRKDGCVSVEGRRFLCDSPLRGHQVQVRYDPVDLSSVLVFSREGERLQRAFPQPVNAPPEPHPKPPERPAPSVDYLALLREDYDRKLLEHARPLAYCELPTDAAFGSEPFVTTVFALAGLKPRSHDEREVRSFWDTFGPLPEPLVRIAVEHAVRLHGRGRHLRVYLHAIRTLVLAHRQSPQRKESP